MIVAHSWCAEDHKEEEKHIRTVLKINKYPNWAVDRVKKELADKKAGIQKPKPERTTENKSRGQAVLPYVAGVSERMRRIMRKYRLTAPLRPHRTLRQMLVHPKDKIEDL